MIIFQIIHSSIGTFSSESSHNKRLILLFHFWRGVGNGEGADGKGLLDDIIAYLR